MKFNKKVLSLVIIVAMLAGNLAILPFVGADPQPAPTVQLAWKFPGTYPAGLNPNGVIGDTLVTTVAPDGSGFTHKQGGSGGRLLMNVDDSGNNDKIDATDYKYIYLDVKATNNFKGLFIRNYTKFIDYPGSDNTQPNEFRRDDFRCTVLTGVNKRPTAGLYRFELPASGKDGNGQDLDQIDIYFHMNDSTAGVVMDIGGLWLSNDPQFSPKTETVKWEFEGHVAPNTDLDGGNYRTMAYYENDDLTKTVKWDSYFVKGVAATNAFNASARWGAADATANDITPVLTNINADGQLEVYQFNSDVWLTDVRNSGNAAKMDISYYKYVYVDFAQVNRFYTLSLNNNRDKGALEIGGHGQTTVRHLLGGTNLQTYPNNPNWNPNGEGSGGVIRMDVSDFRFDYFGDPNGLVDNTKLFLKMGLAEVDYYNFNDFRPTIINGIYLSNDENFYPEDAVDVDEEPTKLAFDEGDSFEVDGTLSEEYKATVNVGPILPYPRMTQTNLGGSSNIGGMYQVRLTPNNVTIPPLAAGTKPNAAYIRNDWYYISTPGLTISQLRAELEGIYGTTATGGPADFYVGYTDRPADADRISDTREVNNQNYNPADVYNAYSDAELFSLFGVHHRRVTESGRTYMDYTYNHTKTPAGETIIDITADMCTAYVKDGDPTNDAIDLSEPLDAGEYTVDVTYKNFIYSYDIEVLADDSSSESSDESSDSESSSSDSSSDSSSSEAGSGTTITNSDDDKTGELNLRGEVEVDWIVVIPVGNTSIDLFDTDNEQSIGQLGVISARLELDKKLVVMATSDDWKLSGVSAGNTVGFSYDLTQENNKWEFTQISNPLIDVEILLSEGAGNDTPPDVYRDIITFTVNYVSQ